jgi:hypothetical protein
MNAISKTDSSTDWRGFAPFFIWAALYLGARVLLEIESLGWWARAAIAVVPVPAFAWVLWSVSKGIAQMDELQRRIQLEALAFAFPVTMLLVMTLGLLELAIGLNKDDWSYRHVWPMLMVFYFAGLMRAKRRYE